MDYEVLTDTIDQIINDFNVQLKTLGINNEIASLDDMFERYVNVRKENIELTNKLTTESDKFRDELRKHYEEKLFEYEYISFDKLRGLTLQDIVYILETQ